MATISSIDVALTASSVELRRGLDRAERATRNYTNRAGRAYRNLGRQVRALQTGFVGLLATIGVGRILQSVDELSTLAEQSGVAVDRFTQLSLAFQQQGLNAAQFANLIRGLSVRLFQFGQGTGEAVMAFERLDLTFEQLSRQPVEQRLFTIITALGMVEDATERAFLASRIFGEEVGPRLLRAINLGVTGLEGLANAAPALSENDVENVRRFNDTISVLGQRLVVLLSNLSPLLNVFSTLANVLSNITGIGSILTSIIIATAVAIGRRYVPAVVSAVTAGNAFLVSTLRNAVASTRAYTTYLLWGGELINFGRIQNATLVSLTRLTAGIRGQSIIVGTATVLVRGLNVALAGLRFAIRAVLLQLGPIILVFDTIASLLEGRLVGSLRLVANLAILVANQFIRLFNVISGGNRELFEYVSNAMEVAGVTEDLTIDFGMLEDQLDNTTDSVDDFQNMLQTLLDTLFPAEAAQRTYFESVRLLGQAFDDGLITLDQYSEALERLRMQYQEQPEEIEEVVEELNSFQEAIRDAMDITDELADVGVRVFDGLADSLTNFITNGMVDFRRFTASILRDLIRIQIRRAIAFSIGGAGGGFFASLLGRQNGGPVNAGQPYIVGEAGPELFVPRTGGAIVPNNELGGGMTIVNNINAVDTQSFQEALSETHVSSLT